MGGLEDDSLAVVALIIVIFLTLIWFGILRANHRTVTQKTFRVQALNVRIALVIPLLGFLLFVSIVSPASYEGFFILFNMFESYVFFAFFAMCVANMGGALEAVKYLKDNNKTPCCSSCCPADATLFYQKVTSACWYGFYLRTFVTVFLVIGYYGDIQALYIIASLIALILLINMIVSIVTFYEGIMDSRLSHFYKILILKVAVIMIVGEGIIVELMDAAGAFDSVPATDDYSAGDRITRYYCFIVLLQYILLSVPLYRYFSEPPALTEFPDDPAMKNQTNSTGFCAFMWEVLSVSDFLLGAPEKRVTLPATESETRNSLVTPMYTSNHATTGTAKNQL